MDDVLDIGLSDYGSQMSEIHENAPKFLESKLRRMGLPISVKKEPRSPNGLRLF